MGAVIAAAFANHNAAVLLKAADQGPPFHAIVSSIVSACGSSRNTSARSVSRRS